jgi:hypothetical protein
MLLSLQVDDCVLFDRMSPIHRQYRAINTVDDPLRRGNLFIQKEGFIYVVRTNKMQSGRWQVVPTTRLLLWTHERNTIKLHVQFFLRMNIWLFETCRGHYN